jgi:hypothetical protein
MWLALAVVDACASSDVLDPTFDQVCKSMFDCTWPLQCIPVPAVPGLAPAELRCGLRCSTSDGCGALDGLGGHCLYACSTGALGPAGDGEGGQSIDVPAGFCEIDECD